MSQNGSAERKALGTRNLILIANWLTANKQALDQKKLNRDQVVAKVREVINFPNLGWDMLYRNLKNADLLHLLPKTKRVSYNYNTKTKNSFRLAVLERAVVKLYKDLGVALPEEMEAIQKELFPTA